MSASSFAASFVSYEYSDAQGSQKQLSLFSSFGFNYSTAPRLSTAGNGNQTKTEVMQSTPIASTLISDFPVKPAGSLETSNTSKSRGEISVSRYDPVNKDDPESFAGCMMIMDDNHYLIQWLAYHYHVLPLRRLILYNDPKSLTTPQPIIDRWKDRIHITLWNSSNFLQNGLPSKRNGSTNRTVHSAHKTRQKLFVTACLHQLHKEGREWVIHTDTDEYTTINDRVRDPKDPLAPATDKNVSIPSQKEPGSILKLLRQELKIPKTKKIDDKDIDTYTNRDAACIIMARKTFGTKTEDKSADQSVLMGYNESDFQTMHWRYFTGSGTLGKSVFNFKRYKDSDFPPKVETIHAPMPRCRGKFFKPEWESPLVVNHYPGTLKQMMFRRNDARGLNKSNNSTKYWIERFSSKQRNGISQRESTTIQQWLPGFFESVGEAEARHLLEHVGDPELAAAYIHESAKGDKSEG